MSEQLFAVRIQCAARKKFARKRVRDQRVHIAEEEEKRQKAVINDAASTIQALVKGVQTRAWYNRSKQQLAQRQKAMRQIMVLAKRAEEEVQSLEDRAAYLEMYGPADATRGLAEVAAEEDEYYFNEGGAVDAAYGGGYDTGYSEWSQQYDENAQAYYWYNENAG